ncbi:MAG TPA: Uma2 family endonuclease [Gemmataceae bacterium]|nr:Uma2 family endonuclease [Gemmataceae bacterium]
MSAPVTARLMTEEEFLALPDDGTERWLIRGQLREKPAEREGAMTVRNRDHSRLVARISQLLGDWLDRQPGPRGEVLSGEAGCRLRRNPTTTVGIDVVYISPQLAAHDPDDTTLIDGVPTLAVEILSPSDTEEELNEKVDEYLAAGVALVWLVDPHHRTVEVHRPDAEPELVNVRQELSAEPHLPGFRVPVTQIFGR